MSSFLKEPEAWYDVNGQKFYSKTAAVEHAKGVVSDVKFKFQEDVWDNVNWTNDPIESWETLLQQRCIQIRENYKHVALWYSSGYDSHTILLSFIKNKIPIDELVLLNKNSFFHDPEHEYAVYFANYVKNNYYPNLKINIIDLNLDYLLDFYNTQGSNWINHIGTNTRFIKTTLYYFLSYNDYVKKNLVNFDSRADVIGYEKAKVYCYDNKWFTFTTDSFLEHAIGTKTVPFYISKELPQLHVKQVHNVVSWFESLPDYTPDLVHVIQGRDRTKDGPYVKYYADWNLGMGRYPLHSHHDVSTHGLQKFMYNENLPLESQDVQSCLDYIKNHEKKTFDIYMDGLNEIRRINTLADPNTLLNPTLISKAYYVRDFKKRF
jgi:hypothetical protein